MQIDIFVPLRWILYLFVRMNMIFKDTKENRCYEDFVKNPDDKKKRRVFCKTYNKSIAEEAVKLHRRMEAFPSAEDYNKVFGITLNRIECKQGNKDKDPLVLKVRVTGSYRKFFHPILNLEEMTLLRKKEWTGQFQDVTNIYVISINHHDYNSI